jgi:phosphatidylethanolamine-binding protein (PEBP) family uncharacterized protein
VKRAAVLVAVLMGMGACSKDKESPVVPAKGAPEVIQLTSTAFPEGGTIPPKYTCDGENVSPALQWTGVPAGTTELVLDVIDPDARGFVHWHKTGIAGSATVLAEGSDGWKGPCPPKGSTPHHYVFTLTAKRGEEVVATGRLVALYGRQPG